MTTPASGNPPAADAGPGKAAAPAPDAGEKTPKPSGAEATIVRDVAELRAWMAEVKGTPKPAGEKPSGAFARFMAWLDE